MERETFRFNKKYRIKKDKKKVINPWEIAPNMNAAMKKRIPKMIVVKSNFI